ncbi:DinB family protein [Bordetella genomosp. 11]|uniref:Damage-inducible protein DinB n=1 Tax=Bordetella genomosp. 11 TaxID=1416808 RepID=A0A261V0G5_9BORD|nr:DinB family protein [Bordetella genomosp. 11]OZI67092.1 damage-inducible protein DinB [Bordetella genomosp. 11]
MTDIRHFQLLARYNAWMNEKLMDAAAALPADALHTDRGAFFGSILGTLNHLIVTDTMWFRRFLDHPAARRGQALSPIAAMPVENRLDARPFDTLQALRPRRTAIDAAISAWVGELQPDDLAYLLTYRNSKGIPSRRETASLLLHVFNHQTHHRAQAGTLLTQAGIEVGVTDLLILVPDEQPARC